jgi:hypothetical protein
MFGVVALSSLPAVQGRSIKHHMQILYKSVRRVQRVSSCRPIVDPPHFEPQNSTRSPGFSSSTMLVVTRLVLLTLASLLSSVAFVAGLGTSCSTPLSGGTAAAGAPYWLETIAHQGKAPYSSNPSSYKVFRNVKVSIIEKIVTYSNECSIDTICSQGLWCKGLSIHDRPTGVLLKAVDVGRWSYR